MDDFKKQILRESLEDALDAQRYRALRFFICADQQVQDVVGTVMQGVMGEQELTPAMVDRMMDEALARVRIVKA